MKNFVRLLLLIAAVVLCTSCRTTVAGPAYILHIASMLSTPPVPLSAIGTMSVEFSPDPRPDVHYDPVPDYTADGGAMVSSTATGHFLVTYSGDQIRMIGIETTTGFDVRLPFYSLDRTMGQGVYHPSVTVHVFDRAGTEIARGANFLPWPLDDHLDQSPQTIPVSCLPGMAAACTGM
jgi:hypothetical protein